MPVLAIDLGATKILAAVVADNGTLLAEKQVRMHPKGGQHAGKQITALAVEMLAVAGPVQSIGVCVPGIYRKATGTVWAPNITGWNDYPLLSEIRAFSGNRLIVIDSDRTCSILGEQWLGAAAGCSDAIFVAVGTGIGAGILCGGNIVDGAHGSAGAIGWMALERPYSGDFAASGCFESRASGAGIAAEAKRMIKKGENYAGELSKIDADLLTASHVLEAYDSGDRIAIAVVRQAVAFWGMAVANLVSLFNPQVIVFGGGVFGPAQALLPQIMHEARKWAQPVAINQVRLAASALGSNAVVYGAARLAMLHIKNSGL